MQALWDAALVTLRESLPPQAFDLWIRPLRPVGLGEEALDLAVPDEFFREVVPERFRAPI
jgi:chromosomal replication initiation ATPase DnaA